MTTFRVRYTGDYLDEAGALAVPDIALDLYDAIPFVDPGFLRDQAPTPGDPGYWRRLYSLELTPGHVASAEGIVIFRPWVRARAFARGADTLTVIGRAGAGIDKIDLAACTASDVAVFNAPDTLTHATASAAFLLILALAKKLPEQQRLVATARWDLQPRTMGADLPGKTLGIVGLGASGRELARLAAPWGMRLLAFSPRADPAAAAALGVELVPTLAALLAGADFVTLHNRLDPTTRGLIGAAELALMKPTACFVNVARGEIVDQRALTEALSERRIAGAGLDVFEHEPLPANDPLLALDNVILTPHWLPSTRDAARLTMALIARGMLRAARGLVPGNVVNPEVLDRPRFREKLARFRDNHLPTA
ncbi:MAG TPA: NAD(P)-dependent oxidoreductase [Amaricoccus sp.]|nr:NAD(P)-dependent oxidoreductase [Amaricoccus sp.]